MCGFTYDHYREILQRLRQAGARFLRFGQPAPRRQRCVWIRHDIDLDPEAAIPLAELEAQAGVPATYLVQVTSPLYNALSPPVLRVLARLRALGHEVGLHLDLAAYPTGAGPVAALARREAALLAGALGAPVRVLSFHRPDPAVLGRPVPGFVSTYAPPYFRRARYVSDSAMRWRQGCACQHTDAHRLQVLTHPEWWAQDPGDRAARLAALRARQGCRWEEAVRAGVLPLGEEAVPPCGP